MTLNGVRNSFFLAEQEREGGIGVHVSPFAGVADVGNLLTRAGFALTTGVAPPLLPPPSLLDLTKQNL